MFVTCVDFACFDLLSEILILFCRTSRRAVFHELRLSSEAVRSCLRRNNGPLVPHMSTFCILFLSNSVWINGKTRKKSRQHATIFNRHRHLGNLRAPSDSSDMAETITKISSLEDHQISLPVQEHFTSANGWESMQTYARPNGTSALGRIFMRLQ